MKQQRTTRNRARNWREYNEALVKRGSLRIWIDEQTLGQWRHQPAEGTARRRGAQRFYSDMAIMMMASLQQIYRLPLRATQGLLGSIFQMMDLELALPHYSTLARRRRTLSIELPRLSCREPIDLLVDSTGIKVYGNGEWMRLQHHKGKPAKHRRWRRLHIAVDAETLSMVAAEVTDNDVTDGQMLPVLLDAVPSVRLRQVTAEAGYDKRSCYAAIATRCARATIRPRKNAKIWKHGNTAGKRLDRDENLRMIRQRGRKQWKRLSGYSVRALVETTISRLKMIFGDRVRSHHLDAQRAEILLRCVALERLTGLGLPPATVAAA
jgi:IS5 family transposase